MKSKLPKVARVLLGFIFFVSGLIGLFNLIPPPPELPEQLLAFNKGLEASIYFMPLLKGTETICGLLLLIGLYVPLALVILAPITIHIFLVHLFLAPSGLPIAVIIGVLMIYLSFFDEPYSRTIKVLFQRH